MNLAKVYLCLIYWKSLTKQHSIVYTSRLELFLFVVAIYYIHTCNTHTFVLCLYSKLKIAKCKRHKKKIDKNWRWKIINFKFFTIILNTLYWFFFIKLFINYYYYNLINWIHHFYTVIYTDLLYFVINIIFKIIILGKQTIRIAIVCFDNQFTYIMNETYQKLAQTILQNFKICTILD